MFQKEFTLKRAFPICGLLLGIVVVYPNLMFLMHEIRKCPEEDSVYLLLFYSFRFFFFALLSWGVLILSANVLHNRTVWSGLFRSLVMTILAYVLYVFLLWAWGRFGDCIKGFLILQFVIVWLVSFLVSYIYVLSQRQKRMEEEYRQLKMENLQSRYEALANQINPHFFFNSLNGLTALVREDNKEHTLEYINKMSEVFRYILQGEPKGCIPLEEELGFAEAYRYLLEVRYANKISFIVEIDEHCRGLRLPVLSILPLLENVVKHNMIDSTHHMTVTIKTTENEELLISNPIHAKIYTHEVSGIGLKNLSNRFLLLLNRNIRIEQRMDCFEVYLPLVK